MGRPLRYYYVRYERKTSPRIRRFTGEYANGYIYFAFPSTLWKV